MVGIAQLVEHLVVVQGAAGSSPVTHPAIKALSNEGAFRHLADILPPIAIRYWSREEALPRLEP